MANDIEIAIKYSKAVESLLAKRQRAQGKGLHEKRSSVERYLPTPLVKRIRYLATMRNNVAHENGFTALQPKLFIKNCESMLAELKQPARDAKIAKVSIEIYITIALACAGGIYIAVRT